MTRKTLECIAIGDLTPWTRNARTHSKKQIRQIAESIEAFGFTNPVLIDERRTILAGHGRVAAAKQLGMTEVPCLRLDHMSADEKRAYVLADNKLALLLHGHSHQVDYGDGGNLIHIDEAIAQVVRSGKLQLGNNNATRYFWGSFSLYSDLAETVLGGLPPIIIIGDLKEDPIDFLEMVCQIIIDELQENRPGADAMVSRLLDLMLVQILRRWARNAEAAPGWLASAQDERISRAVAALHEDPAYDWNIEGLAELCGMSRSSFVALFEKVMGQAPGAYLREWRLTRAAKLLRYSGATIEIISEQVGYTSKEAFSCAFRNRFGESPSTWRSSR